MVQVSYPGVYVQEVPSGARAITGVATSIAVFIGMASRGPINEPVEVLSFSAYERVFSSDTLAGEMTDQVRQFFLNGGQRAYVVRVADGASQSSLALPTSGTATFTLKSRGYGLNSNDLRASVSFDTPSPGETFNLTLFRETFDGAGNATVSDSETHSNLSLSSSSPRFIEAVLLRDSRLATASLSAGLVPGNGTSIGGVLFGSDAAAQTALESALGPVNGQFQVTIAGFPSRTVTIPNGTVSGTVLEGKIREAFNGLLPDTSAITAGYNQVAGTAHYAVQVSVAGLSVRLSSASTGDIAAVLGLGSDNGGVEFGAFDALRPLPGGIAFDDDLGVLLTAQKDDFVTSGLLTLNGPNEFEIDLSLTPVAFPDGGESGAFTLGTTPGDHLANVSENLGAIALLINRQQTDWLASVQGLRLVLTPQFGSSAVGSTASLALPGSLSTLTATASNRAVPFAGAAEGDVARLAQYREAFEVIDKNVDLFNLLILPKSAGESASDSIREEVWGPASAFCFERRAFLLVDAPEGSTSVSDLRGVVRRLRIGLKKDHSGLYWPRVQIVSGENRKFIDPSGSVAGLMARTDSSRGVWKAPAGIEAELLGTLATEVPMSDKENGTLNPEAVNAIRTFPNGIISWGARTMDGFDNSGNLDYKYVPVRRLALLIAESLERGLKFAVFEPNDEPLWAQIRLAAGGFMNNLFRQGAFQGSTAREAYFVKVDSETTTQNDINLGIVNVAVGFAPLKPAEFVVVTLQQKAGQIQI